MAFKQDYERKKPNLLNDKKICKANRDLFKEFFDFQERKLRRINELEELDEATYKTLCGYVNRLINVNKWFKNKEWKKLTTSDIKKVYDDLEDGKIVNRFGKRYADRKSYYSKIFKYKPFELAGLKEKVGDALEFVTDRRRKEVNFVNQEGFKKIISVVKNPSHLALLWLSWDIGENINTLLQLTASNFKKEVNKETKEEEYIIWLPQAQLKRSRQERSEPTLFPETVRALDIVLEGLNPKDKLFRFEYRQSLKFFDSATSRSNVTCEPTGKKASWKDLRSGMACNLFSNYGWHSDDINLRLGHSITSKELEAYFSYLAGQGKRVKKLHYNNNLEQVKDELEEIKIREKAHKTRLLEQENSIGDLTKEHEDFKDKFRENNRKLNESNKKIGENNKALVEINKKQFEETNKLIQFVNNIKKKKG